MWPDALSPGMHHEPRARTIQRPDSILYGHNIDLLFAISMSNKQ
jgi:hypothetical protein